MLALLVARACASESGWTFPVHVRSLSHAPGIDLPADAIVVRGGLMERRGLDRSVLMHLERFPGEYALSVYAHADRSAAEIAAAGGVPNGQVRLSTVGRLAEAGFAVVLSSPGRGLPEGHADLLLTGLLDDDQYQRLEQAFDPPIPNPAKESF
jgi:hypothetical protein